MLKPEGLKDEHRHPMLNHPSPEGWWDDGKRPGASVLNSKFSGVASGGELNGLVGFRWTLARLFALQDGQRGLQDGFWTPSQTVQDGARTAQGAAEILKMVPRRPSDG